MAKNLKLPEKKKTTTKDKLAQAAAEVAARKAEAQASAKRTISREQADNRSPASVNRANYLRSQGIDPVRERQEQRAQARRDAATMLIGAASRGASEAAQRAVQRPDGGRQAFASMEVAAERGTPHQMARAAAPTEQMRQRLVADVNATGRLPAGYRWHQQGDKSIAVRDFAHKPLEGVSSTVLQYYNAAQQANEQYGKQYGQIKAELDDLTASYAYAKQVVERGNADPAYADAHPEYYLLTGDDPKQNLSGYEKLIAQKQAELDQLDAEFDNVDALRPSAMKGMTVRDSDRMQGVYYQRPSVWNDPILSPVIDTVDGAYQMMTGGQSLKSIAQEEAQNGKEGIGFLRGLGAGAVMGGNQLNDTLLGIAENAVDLTGSWLGKKIDPNWENPITKLRAGNQRLGYAAYGDELENATGAERVLMNVTASGLNSAAHMAMGGMMGKGLGMQGGGGTMPTAMQAARAQGMTRFGNMGSFTLGAMTDAYDRAEADGSPAYMRPIRAIAAGMGSMIANSDNTEKFMQRMGIGAGMDKTGISNFVGTKMYSKWGDAAMNWAADTFGDQALSEGTQEVVEKIIDRTLDAGFTGNLLNAEYWDGFADELGEDFFYGYLSGALYNTMALPNYAPSNQMLNGMVTGETETTPETMVRWFEQVAIDMADPEMQRIAQQATQEMQNTGDVQEAKTGVVERMLTAADALVAKQEQKAAAEAAVPEIQANEEGVSMFDQPMQASFVDAASGGDVTVVGFDTTTDGRDVILHTVDQNGNKGTATIAELEFTDDTVSDLLSADDARGLDGDGLRNYLNGYASEVDGHSVAPGEYAKAYGMVYRRAAAGMDMDQAIGSSVIPQVMTETAMQDAYAAGLGAAAQQQTAAPLSPATTGNAGVMNRSFTKAAWQNMSRQQQRTAAANMEVVGQLAKRMNATINIVDSLTDSKGDKVNGQFDPSTGVIDIALDADGNAYAYVAMHELTHKMKAEHAKDFDTFAEWVQEGLQESGQDFEALVQYQMDSYGYSRAVATEEVLCNTVPALLQSEENLHKLYQQDRTLFERVMDWLKGLIADVQAAGKNLSQRSRSWAQMDALAADEAQLQGLYDVMESIMQSKVENASDNSTVKASRKDSSDSKHYDYSKYAGVDLSTDGRVYTYDFLTSLPDMLVTQMAEVNAVQANNKIVIENVIDLALKNGAKYGIATEDILLVKNSYTGRIIRLTTKALRHGLSRSKHAAQLANARAAAKAGELLMNAVPVNALHDKSNAANGTYAMAAFLENGDGSNKQIAVLTIEQRSNDIVNFEVYDTLHAISTRKWNAGDLKTQSKNSIKRSTTISIAELLEIVNETHQSLLSDDVLDHFGEERNPAGYYSDRVKFSMSDMVEETRDLIAVHNLTEENLRSAIELGGFAMPSIAVIKAEHGHSKYGPISAVFGKDTIDPKQNRDNEVYGSDAWTPTFPAVEYEADEAVEERIRNKYYELLPKVDRQTANILYKYAYDLSGEVDRNDGTDEIINRLETSTDMMQMYLADAGIAIPEPVVKTVIKQTPKHLADQYDGMIRRIGEDVLRTFETPAGAKTIDHRRAWMAEHLEAVENAFVEVMVEAGLSQEDANELASERKNLNRMVLLAYQYMKNGSETREEMQDYNATAEAIRDAVDKKAYRKWLEDLFGGAVKRKGIRNGKDIFTPSGNRRSFEATHWDVTLENVVKAMRSIGKIGVAGNTRNIVGAAVKKYSSIKDIKADSDRLRTIPEEEYEKMRHDFRVRFGQIATEYAGKSDSFYAGENLVDYITQTQTPDGIYRLMQKNASLYQPSRDVAKKLSELVGEMMNVPTGYFEAKPRRAVTFDEVAAFVVPDNLSDSMRASLAEMGANVVEYKAGDEEDRKAKLNGSDVAEMKFSMSDYDATVKEGDVVLEDLLTMTAAHKMTDAEARRVAQKALKAGSSTMDADDAARRIKEIFDYASRSGKVDVDGLNSEVRALAEEMMSQSATLDEQHEADVADLRSYLKTTPIALSPGQQREAAHLMDSYGAYRRALFGQVNLRKSGIGLDQLWGELNEMYPHLFPADTSEGDQVRVLMDVAEYVKPVYRNETGFNMEESIQWMTHEIYNAYMSLSGVQSAAKEQNRLGLKLRDYRAITKRFAQEHKAAYEEMAARVASAADRRVAEAESKAERRADMAIRDAEDTAAREIRKAQEQARQDITDAVAAEMQFSNSRIQEAQMRAEAYIKKVSDADKKARYQAQIIREANQMIKKLEKPTDKNHVQHELAEPLAEFLRSLNTGRKTVDQRALGDRIIRLKLKMAAAGAEGEGHSVMVDPDMLATMEFLGEQLKHTTSLDELNVEQMMRIRNIVHHASWIVGKADEAFADARRKRISDSANEWLAQVKRRKDAKEAKHVGKLKNLLEVGQLDAFHFFDKLGGTARDMFRNLRDGWDKKIRHRADAMEFVEKAKEGLSKKVQKELFAGKRARKETYTLTNGSIELTRPQLMELYCLAKRPQARMHLFSEKGGIRSTEGRRLQVTEEDVQKLTDNLTAEEKKLADTLQRYMVDECARWGNETSMNLYGYQKFTEENYYPIRVDQHSVESNISESGKTDNLYAVANMGMTKALQDVVTNGLMLGDIFDTFSRHVDNMATYNGLAAPITDLVRWYNYKGKDSSIKEELAFKFGREYMDYIPRLIRDINGEKDKSYNPGITDKWLSNMKSSAVGSNLRVIIQQPTAILRAGSMMSYQHIMAGMAGLSGESGRRKISEASELAKKYCPIAALKAMGFYETDLGKSMRTAMFDDRGAIDKAKDVGMSLAGKADEMTFGMIWRACEAEIRKTQPDLKVGSQQYYNAVGARMGEIIDYTQVVDTPLHRTQLMRSKNALVKMGTTFMSEPSKTYNMIYGAVSNLIENRKDPVAKRKLARTLGAFTITGVVNGIAQSLIDAIRDDEEEEWWKKFCYHFFGDYREAKNLWQHFLAFRKSNLWQGWNIVGSIPYIKDVISLIDGWDIKRVDMQSAEKLVQVGDNVVKLFTGKNKLNGFGWAKQVGTAVDAVTGLSLSNLLRDGYAMTNFLFGCFGAEAPVTMQTEAATTSVGYNNLYRAMASGNASQFNRVSGKMASKHESSERDIDTAMAERFAEAGDEQIVNAYTAKAEGRASEYGRIRDSFVAEYSEMIGETRATELFDKAVSRYDSMLNDTGSDEDTTQDKPLDVNAFSNKEMGKVFAGLANGTVSEADAEFVLSEMIADSNAQDPAKTVRSNLWAQLKPMYLVAEGEEKKALAGIIKKYCGKTDKDLQKAEKDAAKKATEDESK